MVASALVSWTTKYAATCWDSQNITERETTWFVPRLALLCEHNRRHPNDNHHNSKVIQTDIIFTTKCGVASSHQLRNRKLLEIQDRRVHRQITSRQEGSARSLHLKSQIWSNHRQGWQIQGSASCRRRPTSLRPLHSIDITTAFLYSSLDEEVYIFTPAGFPDSPESRRFIKLLRSLYGLRVRLQEIGPSYYAPHKQSSN